MKHGLLLSTLVLSLSIFGCSKTSEQDVISDAQACLNKATAATVDTCVAKVSGISGEQADAIRCYGAFIKEGITSASKLVQALDTISSGINNSNYETFLGLVSFTSQGTTGTPAAVLNYDLAKVSSTLCAQSKVKSGTLISTFAFLANALYKTGCQAASPTCTAISCATSNANCIPNGVIAIALAPATYSTLLSDLGTVVVNTYLVACESGAKTDSMCTLINLSVSEAGGTSNTEAVGTNFIENLTNP
ncbi:MAG: hypothetical protein V4736_14080 [Bdellovibrionota bacterium]